ncbi:hypothetical protein Plhal304r1_c026g0087251 [Plasmopara halstedii]
MDSALFFARAILSRAKPLHRPDSSSLPLSDNIQTWWRVHTRRHSREEGTTCGMNQFMTDDVKLLM